MPLPPQCSDMMPEINKAVYLHDYVIHLCFAGGMVGNVDLADDLYGDLFEPLKNVELFKQFFVHPDFHTLCWPNGADMAPEYLFELVCAPTSVSV